MPANHDDPTHSREAELDALARQLERRAVALATWERSYASGLDLNDNRVPAGPVAVAIRRLQREGEFHPETAVCAKGLGLDPALLEGILDGTTTDLDLHAVRSVCEGLHCSPYDLWGTETGRRLLPVYGPEDWPRHIEPLDDRAGNVTFISRRLDRRFTTPPGQRHDPSSGPRHVAQLPLRAAVGTGADLDTLTATVNASGLDVEAALVELRQLGVLLEDAVGVAVRVAATPAEGIAAVRDVWRVEDVERLVRLAGYPAALAADVEAISGKPPAMVEPEVVSAPTVSLIDRWAAIADGPSTHPGPAPLTPAS
jgi:hypothetical protein